MRTSGPADATQFIPDSADIELGRLRAVLGERFRVDGAIATRPRRTVYSAFDAELKREIVIKVLAFDPDEHPHLVERLERLLRGASELGYHGVMPPTHLAVMNGGLFYISHLAGGGSASDVLAAGETMPMADVQIVVREVADALDRAHERGLVHGCLNPGNVLFGADGHPRVSDFGITDALIEAGLIAGTAAMRERAYSAPEQWHGLPPTGAADQFSLAVVAYQLLTGRGRLAEPGVAGVWTLDPIDVLANVPLAPDVPLYVNEALRVAMSATPANRFPSVTEFADAFCGCAESLGRGLPTHPARSGLRRRPRFRPPFFWLVIAAVCVVALDTDINSAVQHAWTALWNSYSPPTLSVDASELLAPASGSGSSSVSETASSSGRDESWFARMKSAVVGSPIPVPTTAYIRVAVDSGTAAVMIDGIYRGETPLVGAVGAGHHVVSIAGPSRRASPPTGVNVASGDTASIAFRW